MPAPWERDWGTSPPAGPGPVTVGTPRPPKKEIRQVGSDLGLVDPTTGTFTPTYHEPPKAASEPKQIPPTAAAGIQSNLENLRAVDAAIESLKGRPQSIGPGTGALGDTFTQFNDPEGTDTRARVGKIGAVTIHDLSGAAVSATEAPRFQPFVPTPQDRPEVALDKLAKFREALNSQIKESLDYYGEANGYLPYKTPQAEQFLSAPTTTEGHYGDERGATPKPHAAEEYRTGLYNAVRSGQIKSPAQLKEWEAAFNQQNGTNFNADPKSAVKAIVAARQGKAFNVEEPAYNPDITDMRGGAGIGEKIDAGVRGAADVAGYGLADKAAAFGDTVTRGGTFDENLARQYAISDYDAEHHFPSRVAGQIIGGFAMPLGEISTPAQLANKATAAGAAYGAGSSRTLSELPGNTIYGGLTGMLGTEFLGAGRAGQALATSNAAGNAARGVGAAAPGTLASLVDSATGRLNEPLEAAGPAGRVAAAQDFGIDLPYGAAGDRTAALVEKGLDNLPGSAGVMNDARRVTEGQVQNAVEDVASQFGSSRTLSEGGAELQRGTVERLGRGEVVVSKAYDAIPIADTAPASNSSTVSTLKQLTGRFESNADLADEMRDPRLVRYLNAIEKDGLSWKDLKEFRTIIGEKIGDMRFGESSSTSDLRALYGGLSEDMRNTAAAQGPKAIRAFERANTLHRQNQQLVEGALTRILGKDGQMAPEKAAAAVQAMTKGGKSTGDIKTLAQIKGATVKSGAWDEIAGTLIRMGGQPANSPGRAFDPKVFVQWYSDMSESARGMLFKPELRQSLDKFVAVNQRLANSNALRNTSQTVPNFIGTSFAGGAGLATITGNVPALLAIGGEAAANYGMGKLWTSPKFVQWATGYSRAAASGNPAAVKSQVGRLTKLATTNPELRDGIEKLIRGLANDNAPNAGRLAASPDEGPQNQAQPY